MQTGRPRDVLITQGGFLPCEGGAPLLLLVLDAFDEINIGWFFTSEEAVTPEEVHLEELQTLVRVLFCVDLPNGLIHLLLRVDHLLVRFLQDEDTRLEKFSLTLQLLEVLLVRVKT